MGGEHDPQGCPVCLELGRWCYNPKRDPKDVGDKVNAFVRSPEVELPGIRKNKELQGCRWRSSDAGLETKLLYKVSEYLIQLLPKIFCVNCIHRKLMLIEDPEAGLLHTKHFTSRQGYLT